MEASIYRLAEMYRDWKDERGFWDNIHPNWLKIKTQVEDMHGDVLNNAMLDYLSSFDHLHVCTIPPTGGFIEIDTFAFNLSTNKVIGMDQKRSAGQNSSQVKGFNRTADEEMVPAIENYLGGTNMKAEDYTVGYHYHYVRVGGKKLATAKKWITNEIIAEVCQVDSPQKALEEATNDFIRELRSSPESVLAARS